MDRLAFLELYQEGVNMPADRGGFTPGVVAYCVLNGVMLAFTVYREKFLWFKPSYHLKIYLPSKRTGRPIGGEYFDNLEDAVAYGQDIMRFFFPGIKGDPLKLSQLEVIKFPEKPKNQNPSA